MHAFSHTIPCEPPPHAGIFSATTDESEQSPASTASRILDTYPGEHPSNAELEKWLERSDILAGLAGLSQCRVEPENILLADRDALMRS